MKTNSTLSRPHFFPGQLIDYKDFNRLAQQPERTTAGLMQHIFRGGGVIAGALENFAVTPLKGLSCLIQPGVGILPSGEAVMLTGETILDLAPYAVSKTPKLFVVSLQRVVRGFDRYQDPEDASIAGYKSEGAEAEIVVSEAPLENAIELFRCAIDQSCDCFRTLSKEEEWQEAVSVKADENCAVIDRRFQKTLNPSTTSVGQLAELLKLRKSLYTIEKAQRRLSQIYLIEDPYLVGLLVTQLHAELLSQPMQLLKISFLLSELSEKLSLFLEMLAQRLGNQTSNFDRGTTLSLIERLESLKVREARVSSLSLSSIVEISERMTTLVHHAENSFSLLNTVEAAIRDLRDRFVEWEDKMVLGGQLFKRVDRLTLEDSSRVHFKSGLTQARLLSTRFNNGDSLSLKGMFIRTGHIGVDLKVDHPERPLVILSRQYIRRGGSTIHYEINGRHVLTDQGDVADLTNSWINRGIVVPSDYLIGDGNQLKIDLEKSDLDFGFFDLVVYQPVVHQEILP